MYLGFLSFDLCSDYSKSRSISTHPFGCIALEWVYELNGQKGSFAHLLARVCGCHRGSSMHPAKLQDLLSFDQYSCLIINTHTHKGEDGGRWSLFNKRSNCCFSPKQNQILCLPLFFKALELTITLGSGVFKRLNSYKMIWKSSWTKSFRELTI